MTVSAWRMALAAAALIVCRRHRPLPRLARDDAHPPDPRGSGGMRNRGIPSDLRRYDLDRPQARTARGRCRPDHVRHRRRRARTGTLLHRRSDCRRTGGIPPPHITSIVGAPRSGHDGSVLRVALRRTPDHVGICRDSRDPRSPPEPSPRARAAGLMTLCGAAFERGWTALLISLDIRRWARWLTC